MDKNRVRVSIIDTGPGFIDHDGKKLPPEKLKEMISATYSTKPVDVTRPNRGIGLFVCHRIIRMHRGTLEFINVEGGGAQINITLDRHFTHTMKKQERLENTRSIFMASVAGDA